MRFKDEVIVIIETRKRFGCIRHDYGIPSSDIYVYMLDWVWIGEPGVGRVGRKRGWYYDLFAGMESGNVYGIRIDLSQVQTCHRFPNATISTKV